MNRLSTQYDLKYRPGKVSRRKMGVILGSDVNGATSKDIASLPSAEKFYQSLAVGQFVSVSDSQRTVNGHPVSVSGHVVSKRSVKDGPVCHHTIYVK